MIYLVSLAFSRCEDAMEACTMEANKEEREREEDGRRRVIRKRKGVSKNGIDKGVNKKGIRLILRINEYFSKIPFSQFQEYLLQLN